MTEWLSASEDCSEDTPQWSWIEGRGNGLKLMARIITGIARAMDVKIAAFSGGMKMNAIVSASDAVITVPAGKAG